MKLGQSSEVKEGDPVLDLLTRLMLILAEQR